MKKIFLILFFIILSQNLYASNTKKVYFAGGCFWCMEESFEKIQIPFRLDSVLAGMGLANEKLKMGDKVRIYSINEIEGITPNTVSIACISILSPVGVDVAWALM